MIDTLLIDWHGVLDKVRFQDIPKHISQATGGDARTVETRLSEEMDQYIRGAMPPEEFWRKVKDSYGLTRSAGQEVQQRFLRVEKNEPLWRLIERYRGRYKAIIFADCPVDKARLIKASEDLGLFTGVYFSHDFGCRIKDPFFYTTVLKDQGISPNQALFLDDETGTTSYCWNSLGIAAHQLTTIPRLESVLEDPTQKV